MTYLAGLAKQLTRLSMALLVVALVGQMSSTLKLERSKMEPISRTKQLLAQLLRGENRVNMTPEEALAIADTPFNRTALHGYPDTPEEALLQPNQYHPLSPPAASSSEVRANAASTAAFGPSDPAWAQYAAYAEQALDPARKRTPYTHYFAGEPPPWAANLEGLTRIGSHYFGREKRRPKRKKVAK